MFDNGCPPNWSNLRAPFLQLLISDIETEVADEDPEGGKQREQVE